MSRWWDRSFRSLRSSIFCLLFLAGAARGRADTVIPLSQANLKIYGAHAKEEIADARSAGDVNGDGFADLLVGSELAKVGTRDAAGRAYLIYGSNVLPPVIDLQLLGGMGMVLENDASNHDDHLGHAVAAAGDLNGDGVDDFMVSAPHASPSGRNQAGVVYVVFGGGAPAASLDLSTLGSRGVTILGAKAGDLTGDSISRAGDVNGDGIPDIIIGADAADPAGRSNAGAVYLIFGKRNLPAVIDLAALGSQGVVIQGIAAGDLFGSGVANLGDFNRDGLADIIASAPEADVPGRGDSGKAFIIFGSRSLPGVLDLRSLTAAQGVVILSATKNDPLAVSCGGDFNHDGTPDALIGVNLEGPGGRSNAGRTYLVFGRSSPPATIDLASLGSAGLVLNGVGGGDTSGHSIHCVGDFDGDGIDDLIIGADKAEPHAIGNAGQSYIVFGRSSPPSAIELGSLGTGGIYLNGEKAGDHSGRVVADAGDVNGDGGADVLVVASNASPLTAGDSATGKSSTSSGGRHDAGIVYLFYGKPLPPVSGLSCALAASNLVELTWTLGSAYDSVRIDRNGVTIAALAGTATSFSDPSAPIGVVVYEVFGIRAGKTSPAARCEVSVQVRPPFGLLCLAVDGVVQLSWQHAQPVDQTLVYRDGALLATLPGSPLAYQDLAAPVGDHEYRVTGVIGSGESAPAVCRVTVPAPLTNLSCSASGSVVTLRWINGQAGYTAVRIFRDGVQIAEAAGSPTSYTDNAVLPGSHLYRLQGLSGSSSSAPVECSVRVLRGVENLAGSSDSGNVTLTWTLGDDYDSIEVTRDGVHLATLPGDATSLVDPGLPPGSYFYTVTGILGGSGSPPASVVVEVVAALVDLACSADGNAASLSWRHLDLCDLIELQRDGAPLATLSGAAGSYSDTLPGPGSHTYRLVCVRGNGRSAPAECALKSPAPPEPLLCNLVSGMLTLSWTRNGAYDGFEVTVNGQVEPRLPGTAVGASYDLNVCGSARVEVRGLCGPSRSAPAVCEATEIGSPSGFSCLASGLSVHLAWEDGGPYDAVRVERDGVTIATLPGSAVSFDDAVPGPGSYVYRIFGVSQGSETLPAICHLLLNDPVGNLQCSSDGSIATLSWSGAAGGSVVVERNGSVYATLPPGTPSFTDPAPLTGVTTYGVSLSNLGSTGPVSTCTVEVLSPPADLACHAKGHGVELSWTNPAPYTTIVISRNGLEVSPPGGLPGSTSSFLDQPLSPGLYSYQVEGLAGAGGQSPAASCQVEVVLFPIRFTCSALDGEACLHWINPRAYDAIEVLREEELTATLPGDANSFCQPDLPEGSYSYQVRGVVGGSVSDVATCALSAPESPQHLHCVQEGADILLTFTPAAADDAIEIHRDGNLWSTLAGIATSFLDQGVALGTHTYEVRAGVAGDFSHPASCAVEMAAPPRDISCSSDGSTVKICWTPGAVYDMVTVLRNGQTITQPVIPGDQTCFTDTGLSPGVYLYEVLGTAGSNQSTAATCTVIIIAPPFNMSCQIAGARATLFWSNGAAYDSIEVLRKKPSQAAAVHLATLAGGTISYIDEPLTESGDYQYSLVGRAGGISSSLVSCTASRLAAPGHNGGFTCAVSNPGINFADVDLHWNNGDSYDTVVIKRNGGLLVSLPGSAQSYLDQGLAAGSYDYQVTGFRGGNSSDPATCTAKVLLAPPPVSGFTCHISGSTATLSWTNDRPADQIKVYRRAPGQAQSTLLTTLPGSASSFSDPTATAAGDYLYEVSAMKDGLESTRGSCALTKPRSPSGLVCLAANLGLTAGDVRLTWTSGENYDSINVLRNGQPVAALPGSATLFLDQNLPLGSYSYRLVGVLQGNQSDPSAECVVSVTVQPPDPRSLSCLIDNGAATLHWTLGAVYDSIEVSRKGPGDPAAMVIAHLPGDQESYQDHGLTRDGDYLYSVVGLIGDKRSGKAECSATLPSAPAVDPARCAAQQAGPDGVDVLLSWVNGDVYDSIVVVRIRKSPLPAETVMVSLRGTESSFADRRLPDGEYDYAVVGVIGGSSANSAACHVVIARPNFIRGEINNDSHHDVADAVFLLNFLFVHGPRPTCLDAADVNDDGRNDLSDAIWIIGWQFHGGPQPMPPFPACGKDTTEDDLDCTSFAGCQ
jgi:hypothetical protein